MKTPISYYGGKQRLIPEILPLIPPHIQWVEVFAGGAAVTFAKKPSENEVINDIDKRLTNFYWQLKTNFLELQTMIRATMHSEVHYINAENVLNDENAPPLKEHGHIGYELKWLLLLSWGAGLHSVKVDRQKTRQTNERILMKIYINV